MHEAMGSNYIFKLSIISKYILPLVTICLSLVCFTDVKAEAPGLWPPHVTSWLIGKDSDAGRDWGQEEKGTTEDEMAGWHHRLNGRESEWIPGDGDGQRGLACCDSFGHKESDMTEWLNWTELNWCKKSNIYKNRERSIMNTHLSMYLLQSFKK